MLAATVLLQVAKETEGFLPESQAGFRKDRGCRDNVVVLAILLDFFLDEGNPLVLTYLDYVAAFDTVSHKFLDEALGEAGASSKMRSLIRAIYSKATAVVRVRSTNGEPDVYSRSFPIDRGVLQGCLLSPRLFIVAAALIMKRHDSNGGGAKLREMLVEKLEYADDAGLADTTAESASLRVTAIQEGAAKDADVVVSIPKSEVQHIQQQEEVASPSQEDYERAASQGKVSFRCEFCDKRFPQPVDLRHLKFCPKAQRGEYDGEWEVEKILEVRGPPEHRFFQVRWKHRWQKDQTTWEPTRHLGEAEEVVEEFWASHPEIDSLSDIYVEEEHRCKWCCKFYGTEVKLLRHRCGEKPKLETRASRKAKKLVKRMLQAERQDSREEVKMGEDSLKAVFAFNYLGMSNTADGDKAYPVEVRLAKAAARFSELHNVWRSTQLRLQTKLQLFESGVCSMATHAFEAWQFTEPNVKLLKSWVARRLSFISSRSIRDEYISPSWNLMASLRVRRLRFLGHVLRMDESRLVRKAVLTLRNPYPPGFILMDTPPHESLDQLIDMARDKESWNIEVNALKLRLE